MKKLQPQNVALTLGVLFCGVHLLWTILILLGWAQPLLNFAFWAHMLDNPYHVTGFSLIQAGTLLVVTFCIGNGIGWIFANIWNTLHK